MSHAGNNLIIVRYNISQCINVLHRNNRSHSLCYISCKFNLMVIHMLVKLMLTRHNNGSFTNLQRHDKTGRTAMCNYNPSIGYILDHLLIRNQFAPLAILRFICTKARLDNYIILNCAIFL